MHKWMAKHIRELSKDGITFIPNAISKKKCNYYINRFDNIITRFEKNRIPLNTSCQTIENCFRHDLKLVELIYHKKVDAILKKLIDENYILIVSNLMNRTYRQFKHTRPERIGRVWHHDSRVVGNKTLEKGFGYIAITMFNDFNEQNASTLYVPKSHTRRSQPVRRYNYKYKQILGKAGTIAIIDAGLWHKAGKVSTSNRWGLYSYYGPWFVKPYYRFPDMLGNQFPKRLRRRFNGSIKENVLRLLHYHSTPPINELERRYTLIKDRKVIEIQKSYKY